MPYIKLNPVPEELKDKILKQIEEILEPHNIPYILAIFDLKDDKMWVMGNWCPICSADKIVEWIEDNDVQHTEAEINETIN